MQYVYITAADRWSDQQLDVARALDAAGIPARRIYGDTTAPEGTPVITVVDGELIWGADATAVPANRSDWRRVADWVQDRVDVHSVMTVPWTSAMSRTNTITPSSATGDRIAVTTHIEQAPAMTIAADVNCPMCGVGLPAAAMLRRTQTVVRAVATDMAWSAGGTATWDCPSGCAWIGDYADRDLVATTTSGGVHLELDSRVTTTPTIVIATPAPSPA